MNMLGSLLKDILNTLFKNFAPSLIFAILSMCLIMELENTDIKSYCKKWIARFKKVKDFRWQFVFFIYFYMFLYKTLLSRTFTWKHPFGKIMEGWWIEKTDTGYNFESIENIILFIPLTFLIFKAFKQYIKIYKNKIILKYSAIIGFSISLAIEVMQAIFKIGTFQISDLVYNTLGAIIGGALYIAYRNFFYKRQR